MSEKTAKKTPHALTLSDRRALSLSGITDVPAFDEETISLKTDDNALIVKGKKLHISKLNLDSGDVCIDGEIIALQYTPESSKRSLRQKLFR